MAKALAIALGFATFAGCSEPRTLAEEFPGEWQPPTSDVMQTLAANDVTGCGEFYQKPATHAQAEYVVACTRDQQTWTVWRVWPVINEVLGPDSMAIWSLGGPPNVDVN